MNMLFINSCILAICIGTLETAVIRDTFKDEGDDSSYPSRATVPSQPRKYPEKHTYFEYPLEKPYLGHEYIKISIVSRSKLPNPLPDPREIWDRTIPYIIYKRSSSKEKALILNVIEWFNTNTCLKFVEESRDEIFITITPKSWFKHSLCRTKEHKLNLRKIRQGIFYDMKFVLDFGLNGEDNKKIRTHSSSVNLSIGKLNEFYDCDGEGGFSLESSDNTTGTHSRKKRSFENINDENLASLAPEISGDNSYSMRNIGEEIEDLLSGELMEEYEETLKNDDILLPVTNPTLVGNNTIPLLPTDDKIKTIDDSILFRVNEKTTSDAGKSTSATGAMSTDSAIPSSSDSVEDGVAIRVVTTPGSKEPVTSSTFSSTVTNNAISSTITNSVISSTIANNAISSTAENNGKTVSGEMEATSEGNKSTVTQTANIQPVFRRGDIVVAEEPPGNIRVDSTSPVSRKLSLFSGAKEVILSDSKVVVVDKDSVHEHEIGIGHQHLHGRSGTVIDDEDEEHDGFHKVNVIDGNPIKGRTALKDPTKLWTDGVIPYVLSDNYDKRQKQLVIEGMEEFHNKTCVRFVKRTNEKSYMFLQPDSRCSATIGKVKDKPNNVTISDGCFVPGIIVHELMHVFGFIHEQNRPDRDSYVMIVWNNILPRTRGNFKKYRKGDVQDFGQGYDYHSVMHYGMYDFAINLDQPTIIPLQPGTNIGQRDGFSKKDLIKVNKLFQCDEATDDEAEIEFRRRPKIVPRSEFKKRFLTYLKRIFKAIFVSLQAFSRVEV